MLHYKEGQWVIDVARDCVTNQIDALVINSVKEEGRYLIKDDVEKENDINIPSHIVEKAKNMIEEVVSVLC